MKFVDKIKNFINVTDGDYDDLGEFDVEEIPANEEQYAAQPRVAKKARKAEQQDSAANVVDFNKAGSRPAPRGGFGESQVVVKRVKSMNEIGNVIEALKSGLIVVLNLEDCDDEEQRIIDCIFGANYALGGKFKSIADKAYVITPRSIDVSDDGITELGDDLEG